MDIATLGIAVDSRPAKEGAKALGSLAEAGERAESVAGRLEAAFDAEALAAATAKGAVAGFTTALEANSAAQRNAEAAARKEEAAMRAAAQAVRDAIAPRDAHVQAYRNQQAAAEKYLGALQQEAAEYGKNRAQLEAMRSAQMGLTAEQQRSAAAMGAQLDAMKAAHGQLGAGSAAMGKYAMSAQATAAAMRNVPAQFTDIITSLQGGQAPMTVFMQQGGQLKDMFGGAGNAAKALGGYVVGLVSPMTLAAGAAVVLGAAYYQGTQELRAFQNAATITGDAIGLSTSQFAAMSASISNLAGTRGGAAEVLTEIASSGRFAGSAVQGIAEAAILMEKATGKAVAKTIEEFVKLADEPSRASATLNKQYNYLTASVYEQIKALEAQGQTTAAASLAENTYANAMTRRASLVVENAGLMMHAWRGITGAANGAWDAMLNVGRSDSVGEQIGALEKQLQARKDRNAGLGIKDGKSTQEIIDQITGLKETLRLEQRSAEISAERAQTNAAGVAAIDAVTKANERSASKQEQMNKALKEYRKGLDDIRAANPDSALLDPKKIAAGEAGIRDQFKSAKAAPKASAEDKAYADYMRDFAASTNAAQAEVDGLTKSQAKLAAMLSDPVFQKMGETKRQSVLQDAYAAIAKEQEADAQEALTKATKAAAAAREAEIKKINSSAAGDNAKAQAMEDEIALWGKSEEAIKKLTIARLEDDVARAKIADDYGTVKALEDQISAIERRAKASDQITGLKASDKAAADAAASWAAASGKIESDITNALMRGFENGKGIAENMRDVIVNIFKSMVLEPTVRAIVSPLIGAASSAMGIGSMASGAGGVVGAAGGLFGSGFKAGMGAVFGESGTMGGLSAGTTAIGAGNVAGGLGTLAGAIAPWLAGGLLLNSLMGYKVDSKGSGLNAKLSAGGLTSGSVGAYKEYEQTGGLFGGGTTTNRDWSNAGQDIADYMDKAVKTTTKSVKSYAAALGLAPTAIDDFTKSIEISTTGMDPEQQRAAINAGVEGFAADMVASAYGSALEGLSRAGETAAQTLQRLATDLGSVNQALDLLGLALLPIGTAGAAAASGLVEAFGGLEAMQSSVGAYYDLMYSDAEKSAQAASSLAAQFAALGLSVPASEAAFRALVGGMDISTTEGQRLAAAVINLAPAFGAAAQAASAASASMMSAIGNWGTSADLRAFKAQQLQQMLSTAGLSLSIDQIMNATRESALALYMSLDASSAQAQALLKNQQAIYDFVGGAGANGGNPPSIFGPTDGSVATGAPIGDMNSAATAILDAWQSVTDGIFEEVERIRGLMGINRLGSLSEAQAAFAIANAKASAGDQDAAKSLPELSRNVINLATAGAVSLRDLRRIQGQTALTLERTGKTLSGKYKTTIPKDMLPFVEAGGTAAPTAPIAMAAPTAPPVSVASVSEWAQLLEACKSTQVNTRTLSNLLQGAMPAQTRLQVQVITT